MSSNKRAKQRLIKRYGSIDFLDRLQIKIPECKRYTSKGQLKRMKQLTYHHIKKKSEGGNASVENGALLTDEHHVWFHQQPEEIQKELNEAFQELKRKIDESRELPVEFVDDLNVPFELNIAELSFDRQGKIKAYNRSKEKREIKKIIDEFEEEKE